MPILERLSSLEKPQAIAALKASYLDFCAAIEEVIQNTYRDAIQPENDSSEQAYICGKAQELRNDGYTRLDGLVADPAQLALPRCLARALPKRADELSVAADYVYDPRLEGQFWDREATGFNTRIAFKVGNQPSYLRLLLDVATLADRIIEKTIGIPGVGIERNLLIVDNLQPTDTVDFQWWHFDRLMEQYKLMILLTDVGPGNGPMRVLGGTHRFEGTRRIYDFCAYAEPLYGGDPGYAVIKDRLGEIVSVEGRSGDAFLFDTKIFHAHGRPTSAERNTATIYYQPPRTPLNLFYQHYRPPGQVVKF